MDNKWYKYKHIIAPLVIAHTTGSKKDAGVANVPSTIKW